MVDLFYEDAIMDDQGKQFRAWNQLTARQEIFSPEENLPEDDLVFFLLDVVPQLDLKSLYAYYSTDARGQPPFCVKMMTTLLIYSYSVGVFSSRKIAAACERNLAFMAIIGNESPDFRTISQFRKHHQEAMKPLFIQVLRIAGELGMVQLGNLSTDGTKIEANASRHKAMSYGYMNKELARLQAEIEKLLSSAEQTDAEQDAALGSRRGDELPEELKLREERIAKIQAAKERLETAAKLRAEEEQRERDAADAQREAEGRKRKGKLPAPIDSTPADKAQTNFTDPESKIMKKSNKGFDYCYNAQAMVDSKHQIIVAAEVTADANDKQQAVPMAKAALENLAAANIALPCDEEGQPTPIPNTADSGYFSEANVNEVAAMGFDPYYATGRQKHHEEVSVETTINPGTATSATAMDTSANIQAPTGTDNETTNTKIESPKESMLKKLRTELGRKLYAARKHIVEPVFGQIKQVRGFRKFLRRGLELVASEWQLICLTHNLLKIWRFKKSVG